MTVSTKTARRLLSIGEFAAATQLSPKALRLYDDQRLLQPAKIDAGSGYRYYRSDQVALGRLIRTLRDMDLPLADVARVTGAGGARAETLLRELATQLDLRYAREKRAFQSALLLIREPSRREARTMIEERTRPALTVVVRPFMAERQHFYDRLLAEVDAARAALKPGALQAADNSYCRLIEPLSDEEAQLELLLPVEAPPSLPEDLTLRQLPSAACAVIAISASNARGADFSGPLDAIFDWFDRGGHLAADAPWLGRTSRAAGTETEILWAYETATQPSR